MYLDVWRSGTFLLYSCKAAFWTQETSPGLSDVEHSVILRSVFAISSTFTSLRFFRECATPPHVQVRHCMWLSFTRPSPALVLQAANTGVRRPWYQATSDVGCHLNRSVSTPSSFYCFAIAMFIYRIVGNFRGVQISFCAISSWFVCLIFVLSILHRKTRPS